MKKSQGQLITTILIILLVLSAIVIVWQVVNNTIPGYYEIYECHNEAVEKYVCELKSDICNWNYNPRSEECSYYKKVKTQKELCEKLSLSELEFCKEGEKSNGKCLVNFEKDNDYCEKDCIGTGEYKEVTKIKVKDINEDWLDNNCKKESELEFYRCGEYLLKGGN